MRLKVLLTGKDRLSQLPDAEMLRDRGMLVYRCEENSVDDMIEEVHPDVVIINPLEQSKSSSDLYNRLLSNIKYARIPLIYTLLEDDVYLVNRKRTALKGMRNFIVDNIIDGIKTALSNNRKQSAILKGLRLAG